MILFFELADGLILVWRIHYISETNYTGYVKLLAKQLGPKGRRINGVAPEPVWTPLEISRDKRRKKWKNSGGDTPSASSRQLAELASIFVRLVDNNASFATGQIYGAVGGNRQS